MPTLEDAIALAAEAHVGQTDKAGAPYADFAERAGGHPIAQQVKTADLEDNMDVTRLDSVGAEDAERLDKYLWAYRQLTGRKETS